MMLLLLVGSLGLLSSTVARDVVFMDFSSVFGDKSDPRTAEYYSEACRNCSPSESGTFFSHDNACNTFIRCVLVFNEWLLYGYVTPVGSLFNEEKLTLEPMYLYNDNQIAIPNTAACPKVLHPCVSGKMIPVDGNACDGYLICVNGVMEKRLCSDSTKGFNVLTQACDLPCYSRKRTVIRTDCRPNPSSNDFYLLDQVVTYDDDNRETPEHFNVQCLLYHKYQSSRGECFCVPLEETPRELCTTNYVLYARAEDDSWRLAQDNTPLKGASSLTGNASFISDAYTTYLRTSNNNRPMYAAYFDGLLHQMTSAPMLMGNDLGLYFDLSFRFLSMNRNGRPGLSLPTGILTHNHFALADNSACDIQPTYGCRLDFESQDRGYVVCFVHPVDGSNNAMNVEVSSTLLSIAFRRATYTLEVSPWPYNQLKTDLTQNIDVYFAKDDTKGILRVTEGSVERTSTFSFPQGVRAVGNTCPFIIAAGTGRWYFTGYFFSMEVKKYCGPFM